MSATRIYAFESVISSAVKNVFQSAGLTAFTSFDAPDLRKNRPRVDVEVRVGEQQNPPIVQLVSNGTNVERRNAAWRGQLILHIITDPSATGKQTHSDFRAQVRNICAVLQDRVNELFLTAHNIHHPMVEMGTTHQVSSDKNYEISTVLFDLNFTIQADAWSLLDSSDFFPWNGVVRASDTDWVMQWIAQIFNMAIAGTNAGGADNDSYILGIASAGTNAANQAYSLAQTALNTAWAGTNLPVFPSWVTDWIGETYAIATAGTDAAHSADSWGRDAFGMAVAGTTAAAAAAAAATTAQTGVNETNLIARDAWSLAINGTNAANQAWTLAEEAYALATAGTNDVPPWVMQWLAQTFNLSTSGTAADNATDTTARIALNTAWAGTDAAHSADSWGRDAFSIAVAGTNLAQTAYNIASQAAGTGGVPPWVMQWIGGIQTTANAGTNAANIAFTLAGEAFTLAGVGTNAAAAAEALAGQALTVASAGTNAANIAFTLAGEAFTLAGVGTNAAAAAEALAGHALSVASAGTNADNATNLIARTALSLAQSGTTAATSADSWGRDAFGLAVAGTNANNATYNIVQYITNIVFAGTAAAQSFYAVDIYSLYDNSPVSPSASAPLTNSQIANGTGWTLPAVFYGTCAQYPQFGFSGTSMGWPADTFEQYQTGTAFTALTLNAGTGWSSPFYIY